METLPTYLNLFAKSLLLAAMIMTVITGRKLRKFNATRYENEQELEKAHNDLEARILAVKISLAISAVLMLLSLWKQ